MDEQATRVGHKIASRIASKWGLTNEEISRLLADDIMRASYVIGIYKALRILYPTEERANAWPRVPNRFFKGQRPIDAMLGGNLAGVRRYLDAQCPDDSDLRNFEKMDERQTK